MNKISSGEHCSIAEAGKYFFAFGIGDEAEWFQLEERSKFGKAA